jgi:hypothetical protein
VKWTLDARPSLWGSAKMSKDSDHGNALPPPREQSEAGSHVWIPRPYEDQTWPQDDQSQAVNGTPAHPRHVNLWLTRGINRTVLICRASPLGLTICLLRRANPNIDHPPTSRRLSHTWKIQLCIRACYSIFLHTGCGEGAAPQSCRGGWSTTPRAREWLEYAQRLVRARPTRQLCA